MLIQRAAKPRKYGLNESPIPGLAKELIVEPCETGAFEVTAILHDIRNERKYQGVSGYGISVELTTSETMELWKLLDEWRQSNELRKKIGTQGVSQTKVRLAASWQENNGSSGQVKQGLDCNCVIPSPQVNEESIASATATPRQIEQVERTREVKVSRCPKPINKKRTYAPVRIEDFYKPADLGHGYKE